MVNIYNLNYIFHIFPTHLINILMKKVCIIFSIFFASVISCEKNVTDFPQANVNLSLFINNPEFFNLNSPGGWMYLNGGVGGILLFRQSFEEFIAYDRATPFNPSSDCQIEVNEDNITNTEPCSKSLFLITDGSVLQGPATQALIRYNTYYDGQNLTIFN